MVFSWLFELMGLDEDEATYASGPPIGIHNGEAAAANGAPNLTHDMDWDPGWSPVAKEIIGLLMVMIHFFGTIPAWFLGHSALTAVNQLMYAGIDPYHRPTARGRPSAFSPISSTLYIEGEVVEWEVISTPPVNGVEAKFNPVIQTNEGVIVEWDPVVSHG